jgi:hypothetical protein
VRFQMKPGSFQWKLLPCRPLEWWLFFLPHPMELGSEAKCPLCFSVIYSHDFLFILSKLPPFLKHKLSISTTHCSTLLQSCANLIIFLSHWRLQSQVHCLPHHLYQPVHPYHDYTMSAFLTPST